MKLDQIGLQLYTVRSEMESDLRGTLRALADMGYRHVEVAGVPPMPVVELRAELDRAGLEPLAAHVDVERILQETDVVFDELEVLRCSILVVPWLPESYRGGREAGVRLGKALSPVARAAEDRAISIAYHNHDFEFVRNPDGTLWEGLLESAPRTLMLELDLYWLAIAGYDPVQMIREQAGRLSAIHAKDVEEGTRNPVMPGQGTLRWPAIIDAARTSGVTWYVAEQDDPPFPLEAAAQGYTMLRSLAS